MIRAVEKVGRYELLACTSAMGTGSSYLCRQSGQWGFQRVFTLRLLAGAWTENRRAMASFLRGARIGGLLSHPNVLRVIDVGSHRGQPFLVLDYVEGVTLAALLSAAERPSPAVVVSVLLDALSGLAAAHELTDAVGRSLGLVHGNVGPETIIVGADGMARLAEFGGARLASDDDGDEGAGVPGFKAPEQLRGDRIDGGADLFAAGVVLWMALTGRDLFQVPSYGQTVLNVLGQPVERPSAYGAPRAIDEVCRRALARQRSGRYAGAEEMRLALQAAAEREGLRAGPGDVGRWVQRVAGQELADRRRALRLSWANADDNAPSTAPIVTQR
jgi:serine/threonine protein kinase